MRFQGLDSSGYSIVIASISGNTPSLIPAETSPASTEKFHNTSYRQIIVNPSSINCSRDSLTGDILPLVVLFHPTLLTQYHPIVAEKNNHVDNLAKFSNGMVVLVKTSPITYVPVLNHSSSIDHVLYIVIDIIPNAQT